jgi:hypothetical protein
MKVYAVRLADSRKIQGLFWAKNGADLWDAVDEMADPGDLEFCELKRPGGVWHTATYKDQPDLPDPATFDESEQAQELLSEMISERWHPPFDRDSELLCEVFGDQENFNWTPFDNAFVGNGMVARIRADMDRKNHADK